jgi:hypothetical protein
MTERDWPLFTYDWEGLTFVYLWLRGIDLCLPMTERDWPLFTYDWEGLIFVFIIITLFRNCKFQIKIYLIHHVIDEALITRWMIRSRLIVHQQRYHPVIHVVITMQISHLVPTKQFWNYAQSKDWKTK